MGEVEVKVKGGRGETRGVAVIQDSHEAERGNQEGGC